MRAYFKGTVYFSVTLLLVLSLFSCGEKRSDSPSSSKPSKSTSGKPATQRPYVIKGKKYYPIANSDGYVDSGLASWYGPGFHGRKTSNGEKYNMYDDTAAHKILPMNTMVHVKNLENNKEIIVRINDRGPFVRGRIIDLSFTSAKKLGIVKNGTARVRVTALAATNKKKEKPNFKQGEFYVQIGAFRIRNNALRLQKKFHEYGHEVVIHRLDRPDKTLYQVQVYVGTRIRDAIHAESLLLEKGYKGAFIVAK